MRVKFSLLSLLLILVVSAQFTFARKATESLAVKATSENNSEAVPAIEELRSLGPSGLASTDASIRRRNQSSHR
jgi:hypothetical protein